MKRIRGRLIPILIIGLLLPGAGPGILHGDVIMFSLLGRFGPGILSENEIPVPSIGGSGGMVGSGIQFDTDTRVLTINVGWGSGNGFTDLSSEVTLLNIHGPTPSGAPFSFEESAPALITLSGVNTSAVNGGYSGSVTLSPDNANDLLSGRLYLHIHTATNGGGEARGYFVAPAVPEPEMAAWLAIITVPFILCFRGRR